MNPMELKLDELKEVFELATGATAFVNSILEQRKIIKNKKKIMQL